MNLSEASFEAAGKMLGLKEWPGAKHNPAVVKMFADTGNDWVNDDETPWCAAFVGSVLASIGVQGTGKLNARSYLNWGDVVLPGQERPGDVCVFWRNEKNGWQGHVAFYVSGDVRSTQINVRGGNQGNAVSDKDYATNGKRSGLLSVRRAPAPTFTPKQPTAPATGGLAAIIQAFIAAIVAAFSGRKTK